MVLNIDHNVDYLYTIKYHVPMISHNNRTGAACVWLSGGGLASIGLMMMS